MLLRTNLLLSELFKTSGQGLQTSLGKDFLQFLYKMVLLCCVIKVDHTTNLRLPWVSQKKTKTVLRTISLPLILVKKYLELLVYL